VNIDASAGAAKILGVIRSAKLSAVVSLSEPSESPSSVRGVMTTSTEANERVLRSSISSFSDDADKVFLDPA